MTAPKANQISVSTRCKTTEEFIATFRRYAAAGSIFVATPIERAPGFETAFSFALIDGTPVLRGTGVVLETWKTVENRFRLPGFELGIRWLSPRSVAVFRQLLIPRRLSSTLKSVVPPPSPSTPAEDPLIPPPVPEVVPAAADESWSGPTRTQTQRPLPGVPCLFDTDSWSAPTRTETKRPMRSVPPPPPPVPQPVEAPVSGVPCEVVNESWTAPTRTETKRPVRAVSSPPPVKIAAVASALDDTEPITPVAPSDVVVSANPLSNLSDVSIDGFVECTLYEEPVAQPLVGTLACVTPVEPSKPEPAIESVRPSRMWMVDVALASAAIGVIVLCSDPLSSEANPTFVPPANVTAIPASDPAQLVVGEGACRLDVSTTPVGSIVSLDGVTQGESPIAIATTCGRHRVVISEQHHQTMAAWVTLAIEQTERIEVSLPRPIHAVAVTTQPSGAAIFIDGSPAGTTPTMLNVLGHVPLTLEIKKAGYQPLIQHLYSTTPMDTVAIEMIKR